MFKQELEYFIKNQDALVKQYAGKALVLKGEGLHGVFNTPLEAYLQMQREQLLGQVMIQLCQPGPEAYTVTINSSLS